MAIIIINATAARTSGALTVLRECILYIELCPVADNEYHLFTVVDEFDSSNKIKIHKIKRQNWLSRIWWDGGGLWKWCRKRHLKPDIIISLQNTSTMYEGQNGVKIIQLVYYHQSIPLYPWNELEYNLETGFYYFFYPFFVNRNTEQSHYVVQLPYMKKMFCSKFKNISPERVTVIRTNRPQIDVNVILKKKISMIRGIFNFFYPAASLSYKNHKVIVSALVILRKTHPEIFEKTKVFFTVDKLPNYLMKKIALNNLDICIQFIGQLPYAEILSYYKSTDALLFPSKMESLGYPLLEASCFGLPIIACDLPYAKEVLEDYKNKYFVTPDDAMAWADAICSYKNYAKITPDNESLPKNSWKNFFELADSLVLGQKYG